MSLLYVHMYIALLVLAPNVECESFFSWLFQMGKHDITENYVNPSASDVKYSNSVPFEMTVIDSTFVTEGNKDLVSLDVCHHKVSQRCIM